ncbi:Oidioi.mRNA.OKI2018_I69.chr1.g782.t3.cds [Oikopleura dioica]|nr:Oidioi.mRNA.OKI2018_I69.chr1.g782.t3.cds [Oikopleura dioica]
MRSSKRSRRKSKHTEVSSDADNETEDDFSTIPSSHTPRFRSFSSEMMSEKPLRQASGTSFEFEDLPPPAPVPTKTITIEQPAKNSEKPLLSNFSFAPSLEANDQGGVKIGIFDAPPTPLFAKRALEFFAKKDENCLGMQAMRFPKTEAEVEIKEEHFSSLENSETEDSALGLDENSKSSDLKEKEAESLHQPSKTSLSAIQKAVSQTVTERVFDLLKEYKAPSPNQDDSKEEAKEEGNVLFERLVKKCLEA